MSLTIQTEQPKKPKQRADDKPASDISPPKRKIRHLRPPHVERAEHERHAHSREDDLVIPISDYSLHRASPSEELLAWKGCILCSPCWRNRTIASIDDAIAWARTIKISPLLLLHVDFHVPRGTGVVSVSCPPCGASLPVRRDIFAINIKNDEAPGMDKYDLYAKTPWRRVKEHCEQNKTGKKIGADPFVPLFSPRVSARARDHF